MVFMSLRTGVIGPFLDWEDCGHDRRGRLRSSRALFQTSAIRFCSARDGVSATQILAMSCSCSGPPGLWAIAGIMAAAAK